MRIVEIGAEGDFAQSNNYPKEMAARTSCIISVTFTPGAAGIRNGSVTINDLLKGSPQVLSLAGLGQAAHEVHEVPKADSYLVSK